MNDRPRGFETASARELRALVDILRVLNATPDPWSRLDAVIRLAAGAVEGQTGSLYLVRGRPRHLEPRVVMGRRVGAGQAPDLDLSTGVPGWVTRADEPLIVNEPESDPRWRPLARPGVAPFADPGDEPPRVRNLLCVPLRDELGVAGVIEIVNRELGFTEEQQSLLMAIADEVAMALRKARLLTELQRQRLLWNLLFDINKTLVSSLRLDEVLWRIVDALARVVDFDAVGIFLVQEDGAIEEIVQRAYAPDQLGRLRQKVGDGVVGWAIAAGEPAYVPDVRVDRRYIDARPETRSELVAPMISKGRIIGAFNLENDRLDAYTDADLERLTAFADQATVAIEIARLHERALRARRLEEELSIAREIQLGLMPDRPPSIPGVDIAGLAVPSEAIGGDYYDIIEVTRGQLGLVIGDVTGKGIAAALIMASFRASLLAEIRNNYSIATVLAKVNRLLCESSEPDRFVTSFYGVLDLVSRRLTYVCAGHNPAILVRGDGTIEELAEGGTVLGSFPESSYHEDHRVIHPGDLLLLYTDGITEATNAADEEFGAERLHELAAGVRELPAAEGAAAIERAVHRFTGGRTVLDDLTLLVMRVTEPPVAGEESDDER
jgi:sigma-B regulation protein RsbU (phosphoserine phosphatase)